MSAFLFLSLRRRQNFPCPIMPGRQQTVQFTCNVLESEILSSAQASLCPSFSLSLNLWHVISAAQPSCSSFFLPSSSQLLLSDLWPHTTSCWPLGLLFSCHLIFPRSSLVQSSGDPLLLSQSSSVCVLQFVHVHAACFAVTLPVFVCICVCVSQTWHLINIAKF